MIDEQAQAIVNFVKKMATDVDGIMVHCRAGINRSATVVKWISGEYELPFNANHEKYNAFVYRLLELAAIGSNCDEDGQAYLKKLRKLVNTKDDK